jgi:hypothetical protein
LVKFNNNWATAQEAADARAKFSDRLVEARDFVFQRRNKEAKAIIDDVLGVEPQEPAALYLPRGDRVR